MFEVRRRANGTCTLDATDETKAKMDAFVEKNRVIVEQRHARDLASANKWKDDKLSEGKEDSANIERQYKEKLVELKKQYRSMIDGTLCLAMSMELLKSSPVSLTDEIKHFENRVEHFFENGEFKKEIVDVVESLLK
jgi:hypothetical protein